MSYAGPCPKCFTGTLIDAGDDRDGSDIACLQCGYAALTTVERLRLKIGAEEDSITYDGKQRRRRPSHGKIAL